MSRARTARRRRAAKNAACVRPVSLVLYLQSVGAEIDLQPLRFLLGLVEIIAEHAHRDDQGADDEIHNVAVGGHPWLHGKKFAALYGRGRDSESDNGKPDAMDGSDNRQKIL